MLASTLILIVAFTACDAKKAEGLPSFPDGAALETGTVTLGQVLERTRLAMSDVITYKTYGTSVDSDSTGNSSFSSHHYSEFHSFDRYRFGSFSPENEGAWSQEFLVVGPMVFTRSSDAMWQEQKPFPGPRTPTRPSDGYLSFLYADDIQLISTNELTDDGRSAYRIGFINNFEPPYSESGNPEDVHAFLVHSYQDSYLIDAESFHIVSRTTTKLYKSDFFDDASGKPRSNIEWYETLVTANFYDFNAPVVIEVPGAYVPWAEDQALSSALTP